MTLAPRFTIGASAKDKDATHKINEKNSKDLTQILVKLMEITYS